MVILLLADTGTDRNRENETRDDVPKGMGMEMTIGIVIETGIVMEIMVGIVMEITTGIVISITMGIVMAMFLPAPTPPPPPPPRTLCAALGRQSVFFNFTHVMRPCALTNVCGTKHDMRRRLAQGCLYDFSTPLERVSNVHGDA
jgi:hypothetical protein